jgi:hypothetical protein
VCPGLQVRSLPTWSLFMLNALFMLNGASQSHPQHFFPSNTSPQHTHANSMPSYPEDQSPSAQYFLQFQHVSPTKSLQGVAPSSPASHVESLFSNLSAPDQSTKPSVTTAGRLLSSLLSSVSAAGSSSGAPQQVPTPPGPPNCTALAASTNNEPSCHFLIEQLIG